MRIWLITVGEPLPLDGPGERLLRTGVLSYLLQKRGHQVVWWTSSFDHIRKSHRVASDTRVTVSPGLELIVMRSLGYARNVSLARLRDHRALADSFMRLAPQEETPDLILCSMPTIELSRNAVDFGTLRQIPVVLDIRDLWPDIFLALAPEWAKFAVKWLSQGLYRDLRAACAGATALSGITDPIVDWGLTHAGRPRREHDQAFPIGYTDCPPPEVARATAAAYWAKQLPEEAFVVAFIGTIGRQFDLESVIQAARLLQTGTRPFHFVLCGMGDALKAYQKRAQNMENVHFPGWMDAAQIWHLIRRAQVGLAPYHNSPDFQASLPNKAFEYLSAGLPIVSCLNGELRRLLETNLCGLHYREGDPSNLADSLITLHDSPCLRQDLSDRGKALFEAKFRATVVYSAMAEYLEHLAESHK